MALRTTCYRCFKPASTCICAGLARVENRTPVWLIQHPRERNHPLGTARIARLGLERVELLVAVDGSRPSGLPPGAAVLHPEGEELLTGLAPPGLVVVDGTWSQAKTMYRRHPWLRDLPQYRVTPRDRSRYRLRREPAPQCVSTIEAIVEALRRVEPQTPHLDHLLTVFDAMIDLQIELSAHRPDGAERGWPRALRRRLDQVVALELEFAPRADGGPPLPLHTVAWRYSTEETLECIVKPPAARTPTLCHLAHLQLTPDQLAGGADVETLRRRWVAFFRPDDLVVAWRPGTLAVLRETGLWRGTTLSLKALYRQLFPAVRGALTDLPGVTPPKLDVNGRAGRRLQSLAALLKSIPAAS